ncbi:uncharacterized protein PHACADRAFT_262785 [Phanerochaete carnosa HHB-10118-sp]|uniref:AMP-dependent synthetase/ligase domain-containing protein n=1 Tax=Phanerochaete carnosa (strain HHB-10118-sp) TaxID=650164 RepID=K5VI24_PHACS|nr:uncharacterized protein PHACADRAFT_262785 [Phanerochaete carnosa HHB-10118-sp]EKM50903.1 hypothetical protein PHACADRAFT_262785 [Phanerochaete carnosa HHB-10118-sp]
MRTKLEPLTINETFSRRARAIPDTIAASHLGATLSYRQLDEASDVLARDLCKKGIMRGSRVCLLIRRSLDMLVGIFGILKSGASYIPLDGGVVTDQTLGCILKDSNAALVVCMSAYMHRVPEGLEVLRLEDFMLATCDHTTQDCELAHVHDGSSHLDEAYVIFTSGTTGTPKGVSVSHRNVTNLLCAEPGNLGICPGTKVSQLLSIAFDMCVWEILGCLLNGGTLVLRGSSKPDWETALRAVHVVIATPTILQCYRAVDYPAIRVVATAGEPCPQALADEWSAGKTFYNCCGPTETTIVNTMHCVRRGTSLSIGVPVPNTRVYILDEELRPLPVGRVGTMWAAGACVSLGYVNKPELTRQRYRRDPFCDDGFMFNTGDLGRWNQHGELEHFGRLDDQVKVKGFRVELDGVTAVMEAHPSVVKAVSLLIDTELWGFVSPSSVPLEELKAFVQERLPYYSVPSHFVPMECFPMTNTGKTDKRLLRTMVTGSSPPSATETASRAQGASCGIF